VRVLLGAIRCEKGNVEANLASHRRVLAGAASAGCDLAVLPEMSLTGSVDPAASPERLLPLDDPAVGRLARMSEETGVGVCFGVAERSPDAGRTSRRYLRQAGGWSVPMAA
jgi:predicted amidohydrolase